MNFLEQVFGEGGLFAQHFQGYTPREGQLQLTREIHEAIEHAESTLAEAPCGSGKSLAYLVPSIWHATEGSAEIIAARGEPKDVEADDAFDGGNGEPAPIEPVRVIVVTANIALQEQLVGKDLPLLQAILPWPFTFALAKGKGNYLCLDRFDDATAEHLLAPPDGYEAREQWPVIARWAGETTSGDLSELPFEVAPQLRTKITVSADECIGKACRRFEDCHAERAKKAIKGAKVIVTNYHLFFTSLAMRREFGRGILPPADIVIFDEGQKAADIARDFFGFRCSYGSVKWAIRLLIASKASKKSPMPPLDPELHAEILELADRFFDHLLQLRRSKDYYARLVSPNAVPWWHEFHAKLLEAKRTYDGAASTDMLAPDRAAEVRKASRKVGLVAAQIREAMTTPGSGVVDGDTGQENLVFFIEEQGREPNVRAMLGAKLIDVSHVLREELFESAEVRSTIVTSATLATRDPAKGGFDWIVGEIGAEGARELQTPSPFEFSQQCLLVLPKGLPEPSDKAFSDKIAGVVCEVVEQADGRTLGLFTSYRGLEAAYQAARRRFGDRYVIMKQGEAPRMQLIARFKANTSSVLFGTESFWAGVDVPGESLSCVVIDRIPFESPEDPIVNALDERLGKTFFKQVAIPRAAIKLRQGFGRLIRAAGDRGVVVLLDKRLTDKPYGKLLLSGLPDARRSTHLADVGHFLAGRALVQGALFEGQGARAR